MMGYKHPRKQLIALEWSTRHHDPDITACAVIMQLQPFH